jgi:branched-chain amino acid transport system ATP-binding protein
VKALDVQALSKNFGGLRAIHDVSLEIEEGERRAIIGPNGAGKTTLFNCINGIYHPSRGAIVFKDQEIQGKRPDQVAKLRIARTFQNIELYTGLSTLDNIMAARHVLMKQNPLASALYFGWAHKEEITHRKTVEDIIDFLEIESIRKKTVGMLPYGMRKRVELGRALALEPKVLLLDEPMAGMNLDEKDRQCQMAIQSCFSKGC